MKLSLLAILCLLLTACGTSPIAAPAVTYTNVTGNWQFNVRTPSPPDLNYTLINSLAGSLSSTGPKVAGILHARTSSLNAPCITGDTDIPVTGTLDTSNNLTLTTSISNGTATLTTVLNSRPPLLTGTFIVTGGTCAQPGATLTSAQIPNITGTYTGTFPQILPVSTGTAPTITISASLTQSATPDAHGTYPLTGTVTSTGPCPGTITITNGVVVGESVQSFPFNGGILNFPLPNSAPLFTAFAAPSSSHQQLLANLNVPIGCPGFAYAGVLTAQ